MALHVQAAVRLGESPRKKSQEVGGEHIVGEIEEGGVGNGVMDMIIFYCTECKVLKNRENIKNKERHLAQATSKYRSFHALGSQAAGSSGHNPQACHEPDQGQTYRKSSRLDSGNPRKSLFQNSYFQSLKLT